MKQVNETENYHLIERRNHRVTNYPRRDSKLLGEGRGGRVVVCDIDFLSVRGL